MIKKFWSYLLIGLMSASFIVGPLGMLCGLIPVIICSIVCTINDFTTLKKNPNNQLAVFTKSHIIYALILLITNIGWIFLVLEPKFKSNIYDELFKSSIICCIYAVLSFIMLLVVISITWIINYFRKVKNNTPRLHNFFLAIHPQVLIPLKNNQYMIKKFWSYLLIGLMSASFIVGPLGMLCGLIPVIICSIVCTINDFTTLKKNPNNQLAVFTKSHIIYALILLITNIGWGFVALLIIFSYQ